MKIKAQMPSQLFLCRLLLSSLMLFGSRAWADPNVAGHYVDAQQGEYTLLPDQQFLYLAHPVGVGTGTYRIKDQQIEFIFDQYDFPAIAVTDFSDTEDDYAPNDDSEVEAEVEANPAADPETAKDQLKPDQLFIQFDLGLEDLYIGLNQPIQSPRLQRVSNQKHCYDSPRRTLTLPKQPSNTLLIYRAKSALGPEISLQVAIPEQVNRIGIASEMPAQFSNVHAAIKNNAILFPETDDPRYPDSNPLAQRGPLDADALQESDQLIIEAKKTFLDYKKQFFPAQTVALKDIQWIEQALIVAPCD